MNNCERYCHLPNMLDDRTTRRSVLHLCCIATRFTKDWQSELMITLEKPSSLARPIACLIATVCNFWGCNLLLLLAACSQAIPGYTCRHWRPFENWNMISLTSLAGNKFEEMHVNHPHITHSFFSNWSRCKKIYLPPVPFCVRPKYERDLHERHDGHHHSGGSGLESATCC
jgi:hypothetical protein